jgi:hypothetical protein
VQGSETAHRQADQVGLLNLDRVDHGQSILHSPILRISSRIGGHIRRGITPGGKRDTPVSAGEVTHLRLPAAMVTRKLVYEENWGALPCHLYVEGHLVVGYSPKAIHPHFDI